jgi:PKD repeat protein
MTLIEMVISVSIIATVFLSLGLVLGGALHAYSTARLRSAFIEIANGEIETVRSHAFTNVGVHPSDPNYAAAYPGGKFEGRDAVAIASSALPAESVVTTSPVEDITLPFTIRRWITWTDPAGGIGHVLKKITVEVEWTDRGKARTFRLVSLRYPGGLGVGSTPNHAPEASFTATPSTTTQGLPVSLDGTASFDPDGDALTYEWNFGDGQTLSGSASTSHIYASAGTFTAQLTVDDGKGGTHTAIKDISVTSTSGNAPPTAAFTFAPASGVAPLTVNVDGAGSTDPNGEGDIASYIWDWGDGSPPESGISANHIYGSAGTFSIVLTVTDHGGLFDTQSNSIVVTSLQCDVTDGYLKNPESNPVINDVKVDGSGKPDSRFFAFFATSNSACTTLTAKISHSDGSLTVPLVLQSTAGGIKSWKGTGSVGGSHRFALGINQTGEIFGPRSGPSDEMFSFSFNVHR